MSSKEINLKFCFIDLKDHETIKKDSLFSKIAETIKSESSIKTEDCVEIKKNGDNDLCEEVNTIIIAFARMADLHDPQTYKNIVNKKQLRGICKEGENFIYHPCPMIVVGLEDLSGVLEEKINKQTNNFLKNQLSVVISLNLDAKVNFIDSSIWHRYVPLNESFLENFKKMLKEIKCNFELKLYKTNVAKEFLEFQTRLLANSYLAKLGGGHATNVKPFQFHSTTEMGLKAKKLLSETFFVDGTQSKFKWRLLILDDYAHTGLRCEKDTYEDGKGPTKIEVIRKILSHKATKEDYDWVQIRYVEDVNKSYIEGFIKIFSNEKDDEKNNKKRGYNFEVVSELKAENNKIYDIILIDYLLDGDHKKEYCTEIFKWIKSESEKYNTLKHNANLQGPLDKFWFFPISVFSYALHEEIRQMGYMQLEEEWYLARGADPINTPQLFLYSLFKFMEMQLNDARTFNSLKDFFRKKFVEKVPENSVQKLAKDVYDKFLRFMYAYEALVKNESKGSLFAKTAKPEPKKLDGSFWEHLHHLIFMLGHEPANEWPKIWDEFNIIESKLKKYEDKEGTEDIDYLRTIKEYIINLQKTTRGIS